MKTNHLTTLAALAIALASCSTMEKSSETDSTKPKSNGEVAFAKTVKPLIEKRCVWCHGDRKALAGLNFQDSTTVLDPRLRFVVPGQPDQSRVYDSVIRENSHPRMMPGDGWGITTEQKIAIKRWIDSGAPWPEGREGRIRRKPYQVDHDDYL